MMDKFKNNHCRKKNRPAIFGKGKATSGFVTILLAVWSCMWLVDWPVKVNSKCSRFSDSHSNNISILIKGLIEQATIIILYNAVDAI